MQQRSQQRAERLRQRFDARGDEVLKIAERLARARDEPECQRLIEEMHALISSSLPSSFDLQKLLSSDGMGDLVPACLITPPEILNGSTSTLRADTHLSSSADIATILDDFDTCASDCPPPDDMPGFDPCEVFLGNGVTPSNVCATPTESRAVRAAVVARVFRHLCHLVPLPLIVITIEMKFAILHRSVGYLNFAFKKKCSLHAPAQNSTWSLSRYMKEYSDFIRN